MSETHQRGDGDCSLLVGCTECNQRRTLAIEEANEAISFYRRHHAITGHDLRVERADLEWDISALDRIDPSDAAGRDDALETVIEILDHEFDRGIPVGIVAAAMSATGISIGETMTAIRRQRMDGLLYEPRDDHLSGI